MADSKPDFKSICALAADEARYDELERTLVAGSNLPGPRGNLELAAAFADCIGAEGVTAPQWSLLTRWLAIAEDEAPVGNPREFLPFCAILAHGAAYQKAESKRRAEIAHRIREVANDGRWRSREGAAMALQRIGEWSFEALAAILDSWLPDASFLELRAIVAALAHPPLLRSSENAGYCLEMTERVIERATTANATERKSEQFVALRKGLGYAPSLFVAALPNEGFPLLEHWAQSGDRDLVWIVRENLKKARLSRPFATEVTSVSSFLTR